MAMVVGGPKGGPMSSINITPMVDVLLVLLIIFMIITPVTPKGLQALIPQPPQDQKQQSDERAVVLEVNADGSVAINQQPVAIDQLKDRLTEIFKTRAERVVFVKGDPKLDFSAVARVIDIAQGAGIDHIGLMTAKTENPS